MVDSMNISKESLHCLVFCKRGLGRSKVSLAASNFLAEIGSSSLAYVAPEIFDDVAMIVSELEIKPNSLVLVAGVRHQTQA